MKQIVRRMLMTSGTAAFHSFLQRNRQYKERWNN